VFTAHRLRWDGWEMHAKPDIAIVYGEEVHVPGLSGWLAEIDEQGNVVVV